VLRFCALVPLIMFVVPIVIVGGALLLTFKGSPGQCGGGRPLGTDPSLAQSFQQRWSAFDTQLNAGQPATFSVSDDEATARLRQFLGQTDAPVSDVRLCFVQGGGDVSGHISSPVGGSVTVRVRGGVDLSGAHPKTHIDSIRIGGLPAFATAPFRGLVTRIIDHQSDQVRLDQAANVRFEDGRVTFSSAR
jgi:hypothetical protein